MVIRLVVVDLPLVPVTPMINFDDFPAISNLSNTEILPQDTARHGGSQSEGLPDGGNQDRPVQTAFRLCPQSQNGPAAMGNRA